ncbi:MAG: 30S ribosomal protein S18 [Parcubacteria group bacterium]
MARIPQQKQDQVCVCCQERINHVDYKKPEILRKFVSGTFKVFGTRRTGLCKRHQRLIANAVKRARYMALMPYTKLQTRKK